MTQRFKLFKPKRKVSKTPRNTTQFNIGTSIHRRLKEVKRRETFRNTVVSIGGKSKGC